MIKTDFIVLEFREYSDDEPQGPPEIVKEERLDGFPKYIPERVYESDIVYNYVNKQYYEVTNIVHTMQQMISDPRLVEYEYVLTIYLVKMEEGWRPGL